MVSYLSKTFENSPLIAPLDLGILAKVLSVKQGQFDAKAHQIQGQLDSIASLDIMKDGDRQYVNGKLNNVVNQVNGVGGVDLADFNISGQIEGFASSVYSDNKVINAISSTKKARSLLSSYEKFKTDPKLIKYYSEANEYNDMKNLNAWMGDGKVGSAYQGASAATRYYDYSTDFQKALKDVKARETVDVLVEGFYITKDKKKVLTEAEVMGMARNLLTPVQREQMQRDGVFLYEGKLKYGEAQLVQKAVAGKQQELQMNEKMVESLQASLALERNPTAKANMQAALKERTEYVAALKQEIPRATEAYTNTYRNNPNELMYKVYSDDFFRGLGSRYAQYSEDRSITTNQPRLEAYKQDRQDNRQVREINAAKELAEIRLQGQKEIEWMKLEAEGKAKKDPATGLYKLTGSATEEDLYTVQPNTNPDIASIEEYYLPEAEAKVGSVDKDGVVTKGTLDLQMEKIQEDYLANLLSQDPTTKSILKDPRYDMNKDGKITIADFDNTNYPNLNNPKAQNLITKAVLAFQGLSRGEPIAISQFPEGTAEMVESLKFLQKEKDIVKEQIASARSGRPTFTIPQFSDKTFPAETKANQREFSLAKNYLIKNKIPNVKPENLTLLSIEKDENGYKVSFQTTSGTGKNAATGVQSTYVTEGVANLFNIEEGPYSIANRIVDSNNDLYMPIQNDYDGAFVSEVRVFKNGNTNSYSAQYGRFNPETNSIQYIDFPPAVTGSRTNRFGSPAQAYSFGKDIIKNFGKDIPAESRKNLKTIFESKLMK